jgi:hypothetical protein
MASIEEIIGKNNEFALDDTVSIFKRFNWFNVPRKAFKEGQDKLIKGKRACLIFGKPILRISAR